MLIQCTKKLLDELKVKPALSVYEDELYSWHANLITLKRRKAVVLVNDKNNYSIVLYGLKSKDFKNLDIHLQNAIRETFQKETIKDEVIENYLSISPEITYTKTNNRSTISKLNIVCSEMSQYEELLDCDSLYQGSLGVKLSRTACKSGYKKLIMPYEELYKDLRELSSASIFTMVRPVSRVLDYIVSMTNLYGLVFKDRVLEVYNQQNQGKIDGETIEYVMKHYSIELEKHNIKIQQGYFVSKDISDIKEFENLLKNQLAKPFYIPVSKELLKYKDSAYFHAADQYKSLNHYIERNVFHGDSKKAEMVCRNIHEICKYKFSLSNILEYFQTSGIGFKNEKQMNTVLQHVVDAANNTRAWEHNGHTPNELNQSWPKKNISSVLKNSFSGEDEIAAAKFSGHQHKKIGRNDPCPCGSGRKYKKCCLMKAC